ncbi:hypothetical protein EV183_003912 [Coemansia sp. RSA 2336]|nr:hypothetical protein EV183_003912 [Coemansia sp. RSA 2336]
MANSAGGNSTRLLYDDDDDFDDGTPLHSIMFSAVTLSLILVLFKIIYERWVTPLSQVPGDFWYSISGLPMRFQMLKGRLPQTLLRMHDKYGPVVRISPQRVSINDMAMVKQVLGTHAFLKSQAYEMPSNIEPNVFSTRSPELNTKRRKQLGPSFSHKHLNDMEPYVLSCGVHGIRRKLDALLSKQDGALVQFHKWFSLVTLDVIGTLGFGQQFSALEQERHELVPLLNRIRVFNYLALAFPWLKQLPRLLGKRLQTLHKLQVFSQNAIDQRRRNPSQNVDLLQMMLESQTPMSDPEMVSETILHLVAGVDTTSAGLTWTMLLLLHNPHVLQRLTREIREKFSPGHVITFEECRQQLPYLTAVINESLRVCSPAPSILPRTVPSDGLRIGGYFLPAGSLVCPAILPLHMNPNAFASPTTFDPDRFMGRNSEKPLAFSMGVRACLGRNLALMEMHVVFANLLLSYDLRLPHKEASGSKETFGIIPDIPHQTKMTMNPQYPDRDCLVYISHCS